MVHPTGGLEFNTPGGGLDFLQRLSIAEARDNASQRGSQRTSRRLQFHPHVVTRVEHAWDVERTCISDNDVSPYTQREMQEALGRQTVKMHIRQCLRQADPSTRSKFNAVSADEAWRRADALRAELEEDGGEEMSNEALRERQRIAAQRCLQQKKGNSPKLGRPSPNRTPLNGITKEANQARPLSSRRSPSSRTPGKVVRQSSPRRSSSPRPPRPPSPRPAAGAPRSSTRVTSAPGGRSSFVFG